MGLASNHLTKMSLFAYGTPLVVVAATVGLSSVAAGGSDDRTEDASVCGVQHSTKAGIDQIISHKKNIVTLKLSTDAHKM